MRLRWFACFRVMILCLLTSSAGSALAEALPLSKAVAAGKPARPLKIAVEAADPAVVIVGTKRIELRLRAPRGASVESVSVGPDASVVLVRIEGGSGSWALLLGGRAGNTVLASGRSDWAGDPGERRMLLIEASPAEQSPRSVRFGMRYEGLSICAATPPLIDERRVDPRTLEAVPAPQAFPQATSRDLEVEQVSGPAQREPILLALEPAGSSRIDEATGFYQQPRTLTDRNPQTSWPLSRGSFATLRWAQRKVDLRELEFDLTLPEARTAPSIVMLVDGERAFRIPLSSTVDAASAAPALTAAERGGPVAAPPSPNSSSITLRVRPKEPLSTGCLALLTDDLAPGAALAVHEIRAYTDLDQAGSVERLVSMLVQDGKPGAGAADLLAALGGVGAQAVAARFDELSPRGKRRGLRVLAKGLEDPSIMARVLHTAKEGDQALREQALALLHAGGEPGSVGLRELAFDASALGDAAAKLLSQRPGETPALLRALDGPGGSERPGLRSALSLLARRDAAGFASAVDGWLAQAPSTPARASLALAAAHAGASALALHLAQPAWQDPLEFPERYRFAHALAAAEASPEADGWLEQQSSGAKEWMMRRAAFEALRARDLARAAKVAEALAADEYPRVRAATLEVLASGTHWTRAAQVAQADAWPLVRAAGARALSARPEARPQLEALLGDRSARVRASAIDSLIALKARASWPGVEARLKAAEEAPDVVSAAIAFVRDLCVTQAQEPLISVVRRSLRPEAGDDAVRLGVEALHALHDLGGAAAADAKALATRAEAPPGLAKAYQGFRPSACEKTP